VVAAVAEIGGAWLVWQGWREHRGIAWIAGGILALGAYGFVATFQPDPYFGRILAAYGGIFVAGSLAWGILVDKFRPDRYDRSVPRSACSAWPSSCTHPAADRPRPPNRQPRHPPVSRWLILLTLGNDRAARAVRIGPHAGHGSAQATRTACAGKRPPRA
jgi:small multidrug resistance family-3 protein